MASIRASQINLRNSDNVLVPLSDWKIGDFIANIAEGGISGGGSGSGGSGGSSSITVTDPDTGETKTYSLVIEFDKDGNPILKLTDGKGKTYTIGQSGLTGTQSGSSTTYTFVINNDDEENPVVMLKDDNGNVYPVGGGSDGSGSGSLVPITQRNTTAVSSNIGIGDSFNVINAVNVDAFGRVTGVRTKEYVLTSTMGNGDIIVSTTTPSTNIATVWIKPDLD